MELNELLRQTVEERGSDLHVKVGSPPYIRIDGHLVETAHDGEAAIEIATRFEPDAILLDWAKSSTETDLEEKPYQISFLINRMIALTIQVAREALMRLFSYCAAASRWRHRSSTGRGSPTSRGCWNWRGNSTSSRCAFRSCRAAMAPCTTAIPIPRSGRSTCGRRFGRETFHVVKVLIAVVQEETLFAHRTHAFDQAVDVRQLVLLPALGLVEGPEIHRLVEALFGRVNWQLKLIILQCRMASNSTCITS